MSQAQAWDANSDQHQQIRNGVAVPPAAAQHRAARVWHIEARVVWSRDGQEVIAATSDTWTQHAVLVNLEDRRWPLLGVWLPVADVRRAPAPGPAAETPAPVPQQPGPPAE